MRPRSLRASRKPTNSTRLCDPRPQPTRKRRSCARRSPSMIWSQQFYHFDVKRWLDGDPAQPAPPAARRSGRNVEWKHLDSHDIIVMPDKWEYPWFAALGLRLSLHRSRVCRPGGGEASAPDVFSRVVHASGGNAARVRVELQRRQSADSRLGGADDFRNRRPRRLQFSGAGVPEAPHQFHLVGQSERRRRRQHI